MTGQLYLNRKRASACSILRCHFKLSVRCNLCEAMADSFDTSSSEDTSRNSSPEINPRPTQNKLPAGLRHLQEEQDEIFTFEELELDQSSKFNTWINWHRRPLIKYA